MWEARAPAGDNDKEKTMNARQKKRTAMVVGAALFAAGATAASAQALGAGPASTATVVTADPSLTRSLQAMREEERMARDLYRAFAAKYNGALPFANIATSEQRHFDAVGVLLGRYDVADPAAGRSAGSYANAEVQKLYDAWLAEGKNSLAKAYAVGVKLETADIGDLKDALNAVSAADVKQVYTRLLNASEHHVAAFQAAASGDLVPGAMARGGMGPGAQPGTGMGQRGMGPAGRNGAGAGRMGPGMGGQGVCPYATQTS
jgi:hypothetical protein